MDTTTLVDEKIDAGSELIDRLKKNGFEVDVAFWVLTTYDERWYFYIASPIVDTKGGFEGYGEVLKSLSVSALDGITRSDVRLIGSQEPLAQQAKAFRNDKQPTRFAGRRLGDLIIDDAYIYPAG